MEPKAEQKTELIIETKSDQKTGQKHSNKGRVKKFDEGLIYSQIRTIVLFSIAVSIALSAIAIYVYYQRYDPIIKILIYVACSGGLGGCVYNLLTALKYYVYGWYQPKYFWTYIHRPFTGAIVGVFAFFIIVVGLMTLSTGNPSADFGKPIVMTTVMAYSAIGFVAGFATTEFTKKLKELAETMFNVKKSEDEAESEKDFKKAQNEAEQKKAEEDKKASNVVQDKSGQT